MLVVFYHKQMKIFPKTNFVKIYKNFYHILALFCKPIGRPLWARFDQQATNSGALVNAFEKNLVETTNEKCNMEIVKNISCSSILRRCWLVAGILSVRYSSPCAI